MPQSKIENQKSKIRLIRAPRGSALTCRTWDADEQPRPRGRRAPRRPRRLRRHRQGGARLEAFDAIVRTLRRSRPTRRCSCSRASRSASSARTPTRRACSSPTPTSCQLGHLGALPTSSSEGPDDVRPDDRRLVDLHRHPGHPAGHLRDLRRGRPHQHGGTLAGKLVLTAGSAAWAARSRSRPPWPAACAWRRRRSQRACSAASRPLPRRGRRLDLDEASPGPRPAPPGRPVHRPRRQRRRRLPRAGAPRRRARLVTDQTSAHDPLNGYVPRGLTLAERPPRCARATRTTTPRAPGLDGRHVEAMLASRPGRHVFDYGNNLRAERLRRRREARLRLPRLRAGLHPAAVLRGQGAVPLGGAVGDPADIASPTPCWSCSPTTRHLHRWLTWPGAGRLPGPAGAHLLARLRRAPPAGLAFNELVRTGKVKAPIVIGRDHLDCGSVASPTARPRR
jgi:hypothetical protein